MALKTFSTKQEFMDIVYSVEDTAVIESFLESKFKVMDGFGFEEVSSVGFVKTKGKSFKIIDNDSIVYVSFSNPSERTGLCYLIEKRFFKKDGVYKIAHRANNLPAFISYHANGKVFTEKYRYYNELYPELILDGVKYSYLDSITTTKGKKDYEFKPQHWHASLFRINPKTMTPLDIIYHHETQPNQSIRFSAVKKLYPHINRLSYFERIDLKSNLTEEELTLLEILLY